MYKLSIARDTPIELLMRQGNQTQFVAHALQNFADGG